MQLTGLLSRYYRLTFRNYANTKQNQIETGAYSKIHFSENSNCHNILISDKSLLKLQYGIEMSIHTFNLHEEIPFFQNIDMFAGRYYEDESISNQPDLFLTDPHS